MEEGGKQLRERWLSNRFSGKLDAEEEAKEMNQPFLDSPDNPFNNNSLDSETQEKEWNVSGDDRKFIQAFTRGDIKESILEEARKGLI
jgi:hypothetical protein